MAWERMLGWLGMQVAIGLGFTVLERVAYRKKQKILREFFYQDLFYTLTSNLVGLLAASGFMWLMMVLFGYLGFYQLSPEGYGFGPLARQPFWIQAVQCVLLRDFLGYWVHRIFHTTGVLWPFHAIHHQAREIDWLTSYRFHPVNYAPVRMRVILLYMLGFDPRAILAFALVPNLFTILSHSNLDWTFGPFRYLIVSPAFHRWHHTKQAEGRDKNFSAVFPVWDLLFGTFHMPKGRLPEQFGVDEEIPASLWGQICYPFRRKNTSRKLPGPGVQNA